MPGATIGLFAPSGVINVARHEKSVAYLQSLGYSVVVAEESFQQWRYFAGTDDERLAAFHRLLSDPKVDALMMVRGGYGWSRILDHVDWALVGKMQKPLVGFSDFTALSLGALAQSNLITFAGPGAAVDFGGVDDTPDVQADHAFTDEHCWPALRGETQHVGPFASPHGYATQTIAGPLWGSNLSLVSDLFGTPYFPNISGGILFLEEIGEQPYVIERMLFQLFHAGVLQRQSAILLGDFTDCEPESGRFPYAREHVLETFRERLNIPILTGLPFGHVAKKLTLPFGAIAKLEITPNAFSLQY